ncbi:hypothetical protein [Breznakia pachnodae]|uniref:Uncharacterized protein n=1 Tax=Breznakia pachnodae TaxID=265178 RepID=A0ABU0E6K6_9FIRM|nr:hypothetical protein [Breznakia pachnodae]MDQ0362430.1 hypothetical protein [Breznakia pachnodae]
MGREQVNVKFKDEDSKELIKQRINLKIIDNNGKNIDYWFYEGIYSFYINKKNDDKDCIGLIEVYNDNELYSFNNTYYISSNDEIFYAKENSYHLVTLKKHLKNWLPLVSFILACISFYYTYNVSINTKRNLNMNYEMIVENKNSENDEVVCSTFSDVSINDKETTDKINTGLISFSLEKKGDSGDFLESYLAYVSNNDEVSITEFAENKKNHYTALVIGADDFEVSADVESMDNSLWNCFQHGETHFLAGYSNKDLSEWYYSVHIILQGYNGSYQFFSIIYYPVQKQEIYPHTKYEFERLNYGLNHTNYDYAVITDTSLYDKSRMIEIANAIWPDEKKEGELTNAKYTSLVERIEDERKIIKEKLGAD